jgi:hypothetical protein
VEVEAAEPEPETEVGAEVGMAEPEPEPEPEPEVGAEVGMAEPEPEPEPEPEVGAEVGAAELELELELGCGSVGLGATDDLFGAAISAGTEIGLNRLIKKVKRACRASNPGKSPLLILSTIEEEIKYAFSLH